MVSAHVNSERLRQQVRPNTGLCQVLCISTFVVIGFFSVRRSGYLIIMPFWATFPSICLYSSVVLFYLIFYFILLLPLYIPASFLMRDGTAVDEEGRTEKNRGKTNLNQVILCANISSYYQRKVYL